jgi:hypothetical protein
MNPLIGFVPEPNCGRGTAGIIWNCATTIILCSWTMLHGGPKSARRKLRLFAFMLMFPEGVACQEIQTFTHAWRLRSQLRKQPGWRHFSLRQAFLVQFTGVRFLSPNIDGRDLPDLVARYPDAFRDAFALLPTDRVIEGRSQADTTAKVLVALQAAYFASETVFRLAARYPLSLLEVLTAGYVLCGLIIGIVCLQQPKDLYEPFEVSLPLEGGEVLRPSPEWEMHKHRYTVWTKRYRMGWPWLVVPVVALFTAVHLAAWNYPFPTFAESVAWKVAPLVNGVLGVVLTLMSDFAGHDWTWSFKGWQRKVGIAVYGVARLLVIVVSLIVFRAAPAGIYERPSWTAYMGHVGS